MSAVMSRIVAAILLGAIGFVAVLGLAGVVAESSHLALGFKVAEFIVLFSGVPILGATLLVALRSGGRWRTAEGVEVLLITAGGLLVFVPLLAWLPFGPMHLHIGHMPPVLAVPFVIGVSLVAAGISNLFLEGFLADWRARDYADALANLAAVAGVLWIASWLVSNRLS